MAHWKTKLIDVNWIGTYILPDGKDIVVKLKSVQFLENAKVMGRQKSSFVAYFDENQYFTKPMLLNKTNLQRIGVLQGTHEWETWKEMEVTLCQEMDKTVSGGQDWALRIKKEKPIKQKPTATQQTMDSAFGKKANIEEIEKIYIVSNELKEYYAKLQNPSEPTK